jgi:hypothetical protein
MEPTRPGQGPTASGAVRDRLAAARHRSFVGRAGEVEFFRAALNGEPAFTVLFIHGVGGVGKSALLRRFGDVAAEAGVACVRVDGRDLEATPDGFVAALDAALHAAGDAVGALAAAGRWSCSWTRTSR